MSSALHDRRLGADQPGSNETGLRWSNDSLRRVLLTLGDRDQAPRAEFGARVGDTLYARQLMSLDSTLAAEIAVILDRLGLPTRSMAGPAGTDAAMLIVQHSWPLQERVLALAKAMPPGQISPEKLGMLYVCLFEEAGMRVDRGSLPR